MDVTDFLPNGFNLREGAGGGDPKDGLCFMETVALIAGEPIDDHPECACPILTAYGIGLNDRFPAADRQKLLPLAWATAGTRSKEHEAIRRRIIGLSRCDIADMVLPEFERARPGDLRPRKAIEAARAHWKAPGGEKKTAAAAAAYAAAADAAYADAADADADADAAAASKYFSKDLRAKIIDRQIQTLREAIEAGPNGGIPGELIRERIERVAPLLPVAA